MKTFTHILVVLSLFISLLTACGAPASATQPITVAPVTPSIIRTRIILDLLSETATDRIILGNADKGFIFLKNGIDGGDKYMVFIPKNLQTAPQYMYSRLIGNREGILLRLQRDGWKTISFESLPPELRTLLSSITGATTWAEFVQNLINTIAGLGQGLSTLPLFIIIPSNFENNIPMYEIVIS